MKGGGGEREKRGLGVLLILSKTVDFGMECDQEKLASKQLLIGEQGKNLRIGGIYIREHTKNQSFLRIALHTNPAGSEFHSHFVLFNGLKFGVGKSHHLRLFLYLTDTAVEQVNKLECSH